MEPENNHMVLSAPSGETDSDNGITLCDEVFSKENIECAIYKVKSNKGAPGVDGMTVGELQTYWDEHGADAERYIKNLHYRPRPVRSVEIPKPNGNTRTLGIPCVVDRMIQQAVLQVLTPLIDPTFSEYSFGFRPERSAHMAIEQARQYFEQGYSTVVDIDLKSYFDTVNHDILMRLVEEKGITDKVVLHIIRRSLISGCMDGGIVTQRTKGTPQGGPLSPLLSNIYLDVFDKELESRGHKFVRYADDCNIYTKSHRAGERVMASATTFLEKKLRLTVNPDKSEVGSPSKLKFLGFSLGKGADGAFIRVHAASVKRLKDKIRLLTKRNRGISLVRMLFELKRMLTGWINYYGIAECGGLCAATDGWIRRRIRQYIWKQWKRPPTRVRKLRALGIYERNAREGGNIRKGYWRAANSPTTKWALNNAYLKEQGLLSMLEYYTVKCLSKRTAVYGTVRTVV
ncbi:group II intron reverse transcriptase/maturase [Actinomycetota bacterium]|nr:group II intron reverse transcriptase/maturase [Actinomycetota bacterium]